MEQGQITHGEATAAVVPGLRFSVCDSSDPLDAEPVEVLAVKDGKVLLKSQLRSLTGWKDVTFVAGALFDATWSASALRSLRKRLQGQTSCAAG